MTKNEKTIYKSGRKNENGYPKFQLTKKQKKLSVYIIVVLIVGVIVYTLDFTGVASIS